MSSSPRAVSVRYTVPRRVAGWELSDELMPESVLHDHAVELLKALLMAWAARAGSPMLVARNLAVRWSEAEPRIGVDPDVCVISPAPHAASSLRSIRTWLPDQAPPILAIEVVSETNPHKDYAIAPDKYAASGAGELWVFDPLLSGPAAHGGPFRLQIWHRGKGGDFVRIYAGDGPVRSPTLGAFLMITDDGHKVRLADDESGTQIWRTAEEAAHAEKDAALARVAELEAALAARAKKTT
jgi:Uma2 family endonuclease